jgi:hypothetical protein
VVSRALAAVAAMIAVALTLVFLACGGSLQAQGPGPDCGSSGEGAVDVVVEEAGLGWWVDVFDAARYSGFDPPVPGEYPASGAAACEYSGCFLEGTCDPQTGWCCSGRLKQAQCACGQDAGCVPPSVCCALPGALELQCVASPDECPDAR